MSFKVFLGMTAIRVVGIVLIFVYSVFIARIFGDQVFAVFQLYLSFCTFFAYFLSAGFESATIKYASNYWALRDLPGIAGIFFQAHKSMLLHLFILTLIVFGAVVFRFNTPLTTEFSVASIVLIGTYFHACSAIHRDLLRATDRVLNSTFSQNLVRPVVPLVAALIIACFQEKNVNELGILMLFSGGLVSGFVFELYQLQRIGIPFRLQRGLDYAEHAAYARRIFVGDMAHIGVYRVPALVVGSLFDLKVAALYFAADRIAALSQFVVEGVQLASGPPVAVAAASGDRSELQGAVSFSSLLAFVTGIPLMVFLGVTGVFVLELFGESFRDAYPQLLMLVFGYGSLSLFGPTPMFGNMAGLERERAWITYSALVVASAISLAAVFYNNMYLASVGAATGLFWLHLGMAIVLWKKCNVLAGPLGFRNEDVKRLYLGLCDLTQRLTKRDLF